jgi:hypothetical protein
MCNSKIPTTIQLRKNQTSVTEGHFKDEIGNVKSADVMIKTDGVVSMIIEVFMTHKTLESSRPDNIPWFEVGARDVVKESEKQDVASGETIPQFECQRMLRLACEDCERARKPKWQQRWFGAYPEQAKWLCIQEYSKSKPNQFTLDQYLSSFELDIAT